MRACGLATLDGFRGDDRSGFCYDTNDDFDETAVEAAGRLGCVERGQAPGERSYPVGIHGSG